MVSPKFLSPKFSEGHSVPGQEGLQLFGGEGTGKGHGAGLHAQALSFGCLCSLGPGRGGRDCKRKSPCGV